jgi:hypothetical protein
MDVQVHSAGHIQMLVQQPIDYMHSSAGRHSLTQLAVGTVRPLNLTLFARFKSRCVLINDRASCRSDDGEIKVNLTLCFFGACCALDKCDYLNRCMRPSRGFVKDAHVAPADDQSINDRGLGPSGLMSQPIWNLERQPIVDSVSLDDRGNIYATNSIVTYVSVMTN